MKISLISFFLLISSLLYAVTSEEKPIEIFFTKENAVHEEIIHTLMKTEKTLVAALYDIEFPKLVQTLKTLKERGVDIKIVTDGDAQSRPSVIQIQELGIPIVFDKRKSLMHHKFMVIDSKIIWTGSVNFTKTDLYFNRNNALCLYNPSLASLYESEFLLMFEKNDFSLFSQSPAPFSIGKLEIQVFFPPRNNDAEAALLEQVSSAQKSIKIAAFALTHTKLIQLLEEKIEKGIEVTILLDKGQAKNKRSIFQRMDSKAIEIYQGKGKLHHKFIIIDEAIVLTGSFNFTKAAAAKNNENLILLKNKNLAKIFELEFQRCQKAKKTKD